MHLPVRPEYWLASALLFFFFFAWSSSYSLFSIWLHRVIGLNSAETGFVFAANAIATLIVQPFYGVLQDRLGLSRKLLVWIGVLLSCVAPFALHAYASLLAGSVVPGALLGAAFLAFAMLAAVGVIESYTERLSRHAGFEFGATRMWGSLGWAAATAVAGVAFDIDPDIAFYMGSTAGIAFLLVLSRLDPGALRSHAAQASGAPAAAPVHAGDILQLLRLPRFWAFSLFLTGVTGIYMVYEQQFPLYFVSFFPSPDEGVRAYGYLNSSQVLAEAVLMLLAPRVVARTGAKYGLLLAGAIMLVRILGSGLATEVWAVATCKMLHALEVPLLLVAVFKYIAVNFDPRLSATLYVVGYQCAQQLTAMLLAPLVGLGYDRLGFANIYLLLAGLVGGCLLLSWSLLRADPARQAVPATPPGPLQLPAAAQSAVAHYEP